MLVLDLDATDDPTHGHQEGRFFHGYYGHYCYLPLYIFCGESLLWSELRPSNIDGSLGSVHALRCIRCGSRFAREEVSMEELPPLCRCGGELKYDVVHFREPIPPDVMTESEREASKCDLMLICGTSAVVYPFAGLPRMARIRPGRLVSAHHKRGPKANVKIMEINAEPTPLTHEGVSDYLIRGKTGEILPRICDLLDHSL